MFKDLNGEREGARVLPVWYVGMRRLHGISNFFVELLNLLSDYLQRPRAQEAQQIFVMRGRFPEVSLSFRNSDTYLEVFLESLPGAGFYVML